MFMGMEGHGNPFMNLDGIEATWKIEIFITALQKPSCLPKLQYQLTPAFQGVPPLQWGKSGMRMLNRPRARPTLWASSSSMLCGRR